MTSTYKQHPKRKNDSVSYTLPDKLLAFLPLMLFSLTVIIEQTAGDIFMAVLFTGVFFSTYAILNRRTPLWSAGWLGMTATLPFFLSIYDYHIYAGMIYPLIVLGILLSIYVAYRLFTMSNLHLAIGVFTALITLAARWMVFTSFGIGMLEAGSIIAIFLALVAYTFSKCAGRLYKPGTKVTV